MEEDRTQALLEELVNETRSQNRRMKRISLFLGVLVVVLLCTSVYLFLMISKLKPELDSLIAQSSTVMGKMETVLTQLDEITGQLARADLEGVVEKLNGIDLETLNGSIESLYKIVEPLSRLFSR